MESENDGGSCEPSQTKKPNPKQRYCCTQPSINFFVAPVGFRKFPALISVLILLLIGLFERVL